MSSHEIKKELNKDGFVELLEGKPWKMAPGGKYYVTRNNSSIIALKVGSNLENYSFISNEIRKRLTEKKLRYYRSLYTGPTPNNQIPK